MCFLCLIDRIYLMLHVVCDCSLCVFVSYVLLDVCCVLCVGRCSFSLFIVVRWLLLLLFILVFVLRICLGCWFLCFVYRRGLLFVCVFNRLMVFAIVCRLLLFVV